jgi:hypothetical protein
MFTSKDGTWEECSAYVEQLKMKYNVSSSNLYPTGPADKDGVQKWHVDITYTEEKK